MVVKTPMAAHQCAGPSAPLPPSFHSASTIGAASRLQQRRRNLLLAGRVTDAKPDDSTSSSTKDEGYLSPMPKDVTSHVGHGHTTDSKGKPVKVETNADSSSSNFPDVRNLRVPQVHLPPRLAPEVGWQHHHRATLNLVRGDHSHKPPPPPPRQPAEEKKLQATAEETSSSSTSSPSEPTKPNPVAGFWSKVVPNSQNPLVSATPEWKRLEQHAKYIQSTHLRDLLQDEVRCEAMYAEHDGVYLDYSRQRANLETMKLLMDLAKRQNLQQQIENMFHGEKINFTEERAVLHTALRADRTKEGTVFVDGVDVVKEVHEVLDQIKEFTEGVRSGAMRGYTGKRLRNIVSVGIGGSYLGPEFLHEVLKTEPQGINAALGYSLRFLANVDPVDVERTCADLDPEETLIVIVSKTFTTAETMLNARTMRQWLWDFMGNDKEVVRKHFVACASVSATENVRKFGIDTENRFFRFWDWVGGRYSVCSAAGAVPLSLLYGFDLFEKFLKVSDMQLYFLSSHQWSSWQLIIICLGCTLHGRPLPVGTYGKEHSHYHGAFGSLEHVLPWIQHKNHSSLR
jgi:Phosphoglucose isomerase